MLRNGSPNGLCIGASQPSSWMTITKWGTYSCPSKSCALGWVHLGTQSGRRWPSWRRLKFLALPHVEGRGMYAGCRSERLLRPGGPPRLEIGEADDAQRVPADSVQLARCLAALARSHLGGSAYGSGRLRSGRRTHDLIVRMIVSAPRL